jgi:hypothetical protein
MAQAAQKFSSLSFYVKLRLIFPDTTIHSVLTTTDARFQVFTVMRAHAVDF